MKVRELFREDVVTVDIDESLFDAAGRMEFNEVGCLAVLQHGTLLGVITERDIVRAIAEGAEPTGATVGDYMTHQPAVVAPDADASEAARMMLDLGARHLPVVEDDRIVGMVSARDLLIDVAWEVPPSAEAG